MSKQEMIHDELIEKRRLVEKLDQRIKTLESAMQKLISLNKLYGFHEIPEKEIDKLCDEYKKILEENERDN